MGKILQQWYVSTVKADFGQETVFLKFAIHTWYQANSFQMVNEKSNHVLTMLKGPD